MKGALPISKKPSNIPLSISTFEYHPCCFGSTYTGHAFTVVLFLEINVAVKRKASSRIMTCKNDTIVLPFLLGENVGPNHCGRN